MAITTIGTIPQNTLHVAMSSNLKSSVWVAIVGLFSLWRHAGGMLEHSKLGPYRALSCVGHSSFDSLLL